LRFVEEGLLNYQLCTLLFTSNTRTLNHSTVVLCLHLGFDIPIANFYFLLSCSTTENWSQISLLVKHTKTKLISGYFENLTSYKKLPQFVTLEAGFGFIKRLLSAKTVSSFSAK
jgi:hypothetical protein